jgi:hypothetical protein
VITFKIQWLLSTEVVVDMHHIYNFYDGLGTRQEMEGNKVRNEKLYTKGFNKEHYYHHFIYYND